MLERETIRRGKKAYDIVKNMPFEEKDVNSLKGLPAMIMQNGLGQTIAYLAGKDPGKAQMLCKALFDNDDPNNALTQIVEMPTEEYLRKQEEAIDYAGWFKKYALAFKKAAPAAAAPEEASEGGGDGETTAE